MEFYPIDLAIHLVNIAILFFVLRLLIWKPVVKFMAAREARVAKQLDDAKAASVGVTAAKQEYDNRIAAMEQTCEQLLSDSQQQAQQMSQKLLQTAQEEARQVLIRAQEEARVQKERAVADSFSELSLVAVDLAGKILKFEVDTNQTPIAQAVVKQGRKYGTLKLAQPLEAEEIEMIVHRLEAQLGCWLELTTEVDATLLGGYCARIDGKMYDYSYAAQLNAVKRQIS